MVHHCLCSLELTKDHLKKLEDFVGVQAVVVEHQQVLVVHRERMVDVEDKVAMVEVRMLALKKYFKII